MVTTHGEATGWASNGGYLDDGGDRCLCHGGGLVLFLVFHELERRFGFAEDFRGVDQDRNAGARSHVVDLFPVAHAGGIAPAVARCVGSHCRGPKAKELVGSFLRALGLWDIGSLFIGALQDTLARA